MIDYIVIRRGQDVPEDWHIGNLDGRWFDRTQFPAEDSASPTHFSGAQAVPTGRFEVRDDGAVAEVWELLPFYA